MDNEPANIPAPLPTGVEHPWLSNPLDWPPIDRMILLAVLVMISPLAFGGAVLATLILAPSWLDEHIATWLLGFYAAHVVVLAWFLLSAFRRRQHQSTWPLMEDFVIGSFLAITFIESWLSGTHFTAGLLLLFLGTNVAAALTDIRKLQRAYAVICVAIVVLALMEYSGKFRYAPLFAHPPYHADGSPVLYWFALQVTLALILLGLLFIGLLTTERWGNRENLYREMSTIDGLTRLTNRRSFIERSESEFLRAQRIPSARISCIMLDIDHFKSINDTYGHPAGDAVLVRVSAIMLENARQYDEVGRYGGEEFAILLPATPQEHALQVAERLRMKIAAAEIIVDGHTIRVTASLGVAGFPGADIRNIGDLLKAADKALYSAKETGRNKVVGTVPPGESA